MSRSGYDGAIQLGDAGLSATLASAVGRWLVTDVTGSIIFFDTEHYVYGLSSMIAASRWLEPLTVEEVDSVYDGAGHALEIRLIDGNYCFEVATSPRDSLAHRVSVAHDRGKLLDIMVNQSDSAITAQLSRASRSGSPIEHFRPMTA